MNLFILFKYGKTNGINIIQNLSAKYIQKILDHAKRYATDATKNCLKNNN